MCVKFAETRIQGSYYFPPCKDYFYDPMITVCVCKPSWGQSALLPLRVLYVILGMEEILEDEALCMLGMCGEETTQHKMYLAFRIR